ncbi:mite allergen Eur m 3 isoform X1 [Drosophila rhopaloa]|uniref:trypsin n=1 Tax=Drosophila rhopaloa TaxID=1041015 RepID=A0ABM5GXX4_DRORH|nr:mite allergen Eur m 3 isoform X1 [Drosophila rhopaloa]
MLLVNNNVSRNLCSFLLFFMLLLPLSSESGTHYILRREKRLSSPLFDEKKTLTLAKYVVSIRSRSPRHFFGDNHFCGGVIVSQTYILTSAHCAMDKRKIIHGSRVLLVVAGNVNRLKYHSGLTVQTPVKKIFVPEKFTVFNTHNIALMMLDKKLPLDNPQVGVINLPTNDPEPGINYTVLGWGRIYKGGPLASNILHIDVELLPREICEKKLHTFKEEMMCAGNLNNSLDENPCAGDTGSPLIHNETVFGVVSYRIGCGSKTLPSVYTNVFVHLDWINKIMEQNEGNCLKYSPNHYLLIPMVIIVIGNKFLNSCGFYLITT